MAMHRMLAIAAVAMLGSGCATYSWYRADTPADVTARDQADCYDVARESASHVAFSASPRLYGPGQPWTPLGGSEPYWGPASGPVWRADVEQRLHEECMRRRGYDLRRAPKT